MYFVCRSFRNEKGYLTTMEYIIYENPQTNLANQSIGENATLENTINY